MKGFRYEIIVYHRGHGDYPDFFKLGVKFPDNTEIKPITNAYLWRSMGRFSCSDQVTSPKLDISFETTSNNIQK